MHLPNYSLDQIDANVLTDKENKFIQNLKKETKSLQLQLKQIQETQKKQESVTPQAQTEVKDTEISKQKGVNLENDGAILHLTMKSNNIGQIILKTKSGETIALDVGPHLNKSKELLTESFNKETSGLPIADSAPMPPLLSPSLSSRSVVPPPSPLPSTTPAVGPISKDLKLKSESQTPKQEESSEAKEIETPDELAKDKVVITPKEETFLVNVKTVKGRMIPLEVKPTDTVNQIKSIIQVVEGTPASIQKLLIKSGKVVKTLLEDEGKVSEEHMITQLDDDRTLPSYNVKAGDTLLMFKQVRTPSSTRAGSRVPTAMRNRASSIRDRGKSPSDNVDTNTRTPSQAPTRPQSIMQPPLLAPKPMNPPQPPPLFQLTPPNISRSGTRLADPFPGSTGQFPSSSRRGSISSVAQQAGLMAEPSNAAPPLNVPTEPPGNLSRSQSRGSIRNHSRGPSLSQQPDASIPVISDLNSHQTPDIITSTNITNRSPGIRVSSYSGVPSPVLPVNAPPFTPNYSSNSRSQSRGPTFIQQSDAPNSVIPNHTLRSRAPSVRGSSRPPSVRESNRPPSRAPSVSMPFNGQANSMTEPFNAPPLLNVPTEPPGNLSRSQSRGSIRNHSRGPSLSQQPDASIPVISDLNSHQTPDIITSTNITNRAPGIRVSSYSGVPSPVLPINAPPFTPNYSSNSRSQSRGPTFIQQPDAPNSIIPNHTLRSRTPSVRGSSRPPSVRESSRPPSREPDFVQQSNPPAPFIPDYKSSSRAPSVRESSRPPSRGPDFVQQSNPPAPFIPDYKSSSRAPSVIESSRPPSRVHSKPPSRVHSRPPSRVHSRPQSSHISSHYSKSVKPIMPNIPSQREDPSQMPYLPEKDVRVFLSTLEGRKFMINLKPDDTIYDVKNIVKKLQGILIADQKLVYRGQVLPDSERIKNIRLHDSTFRLITRNRIGPTPRGLK